MNAWRLEGYDTFSAEWYRLDGDYPDQESAETAGQECLTMLERTQPSASSGGQNGIQDRVYVVRPDTSKYRLWPGQPPLAKESAPARAADPVPDDQETNSRSISSPGLHHVWCCDPDRAMCGADISSEPVTTGPVDGEEICGPCHLTENLNTGCPDPRCPHGEDHHEHHGGT